MNKIVGGPELIYGLVGAVGTDLEEVSTLLDESLKEHNYTSSVIKLSDILGEISKKGWPPLINSPEDKRILTRMDRGNRLRGDTERGDGLAILSINKIQNIRNKRMKADNKPIPRHAYILRSLKHPAEVTMLKKVYRSNFILISVYAPEEQRRQKLISLIADTHYEAQTRDHHLRAGELINRDEYEDANIYGQNVRGTYPLADVFFSASNNESLKKAIFRFQDLLFGEAFCTPSKDEYAMAHASIAALRSASMARQVGAAISTEDGEIISVGTNEVPKAKGGLYWEGDPEDKRDFKNKHDVSDSIRHSILGEILTKLKDAKWLSLEKMEMSNKELLDEALIKGAFPVLKRSQSMNIIEFGRAVHAEMAAICYAARRGIALNGCKLFSTTFPCHECARHIVATGIQKVIYIEPYPKSRVGELYPDSISIDKDGDESHVGFVPFVGVNPRLYLRLFRGDEKRYKINGVVPKNDKKRSLPLVLDMPPLNIIHNERKTVADFHAICKKKGIRIGKGGK